MKVGNFQPIILGILTLIFTPSHAMLLLQICEHPFNRLFPLFVNVSVRFRVPQMTNFFQIMRPNMAADPLGAILAFRTLCQ
jgi:hypothetical protein